MILPLSKVRLTSCSLPRKLLPTLFLVPYPPRPFLLAEDACHKIIMPTQLPEVYSLQVYQTSADMIHILGIDAILTNGHLHFLLYNCLLASKYSGMQGIPGPITRDNSICHPKLFHDTCRQHWTSLEALVWWRTPEEGEPACLNQHTTPEIFPILEIPSNIVPASNTGPIQRP